MDNMVFSAPQKVIVQMCHLWRHGENKWVYFVLCKNKTLVLCGVVVKIWKSNQQSELFLG